MIWRRGGFNCCTCRTGLLVRQCFEYLVSNIDSRAAVDDIAQGQYEVVLLSLSNDLDSLGGGQLKRGDLVVLAQTQIFAHLPLPTLKFPIKRSQVAFLAAAFRFRHAL